VSVPSTSVSGNAYKLPGASNVNISIHDFQFAINLPMSSPLTYKYATNEYIPTLDLVDISFNHDHSHILTAWRDESSRQLSSMQLETESFLIASFSVLRDSHSSSNVIMDANEDINNHMLFKMETVSSINEDPAAQDMPALSADVDQLAQLRPTDRQFVEKALTKVREMLALGDESGLIVSLSEREERYSHYEDILLVS
jgi:hypothetical protein